MLHVTIFDALADDDEKDSDTSGEYMICTILYLENSDKAIFYDLKKRVDNN